jgi:hypothetical protein
MQSTDEVYFLADALIEKFLNRTDVYSVQTTRGGYIKVEEPLTRRVIAEHLRGKRTVGVYQLSQDSSVKWLCFDLDPEKLSDPSAAARAILNVCFERRLDKDGVERPRVWQHSVLLEASRYPDPSYHVWILFLLPAPAKVARWLGLRILELASLDPRVVEVFPKQVSVSEHSPYGNLVKLPLGLHRVERKWSRFLDFETFAPLPGEVLLEKVGLSFTEADVEKIMGFKDGSNVQVHFDASASGDFKPLLSGEEEFCVNFLSKLWVPGYRNQVEMAFLGWCIKNSVSYECARRIIEEVAKRRNDEEFAERLRLVDYHYRNRRHLGRRLRGFSGLKEAVMEVLMKG